MSHDSRYRTSPGSISDTLAAMPRAEVVAAMLDAANTDDPAAALRSHVEAASGGQFAIEDLARTLPRDQLAAAMLRASADADPSLALRREMAALAVTTKADQQDPLVVAVHQNNLDDVLPELLANASFSPAESLNRIDIVTTGFAAKLRAEASRLVSRAAQQSVIATSAPIPVRTVLPHVTLFADGPSASLAAVLRSEGYVEERYAGQARPVFVHAEHSLRFSVLGTDSESHQAPTPSQSGAPGSLGGLLSTPLGLIDPLLRFAGVEPGDLIVDLGCGDARVLIEAASRFGAKCLGIESDPAVFEIARQNVEQSGHQDAIQLVHDDAESIDVAMADVVFAFVPPHAARRVIEQVHPQLKSSARLVVHEVLAFDYPVEPTAVEVLASGELHAIDESGVTVAAKWESPQQ